MDRELMKTRFLALSQSDKELVLLSVLYNLTIAIRDIFHTQPDSVKIDAARAATEVNHKVLPFIVATKAGRSRYPDDILIDIVIDILSTASLLKYLPQIWDVSVASNVSPTARS